MRPAVKWISVSLLGLAVYAGSLFAQQTPPPKVPFAGWPTPLTSYSQVAGFWRVDQTFQSDLYLTNHLATNALAVQPTLYLEDGTSFPLQPITLQPYGIADVNLNAAYNALPTATTAQHAKFGSIGITYNWHWQGAATAEIHNIDSTRSVSYSSGLRPSANPTIAAQTIRGLWWKKSTTTTAWVRLTNVSPSMIAAQLSVSDQNNQNLETDSVSLSPFQTVIREIPAVVAALPGSLGGVDISYAGQAGGLIADGGLEDVKLGFSVRLPLSAPSNNPSTPLPGAVTLASTGIMIGRPNPTEMFPSEVNFRSFLTMRNIAAGARTVAVSGTYMFGSEAVTVPLGNIKLAPSTTGSIDVAGAISQLNLPPLIGEISLAYSFQGNPRDLVVSAGSVDDGGSYVFEVPAGLAAPGISKDICSWKSGDGVDTMISVWNHDTAAKDMVLTLHFDGARSYEYPIHLAAQAVATVNTSQILHMETPDAEGNVIPSNAETGSATLSGAAGELDPLNVTVSASSYNVTNATCIFRCISCNGMNTTLFIGPDAPIDAGGSQQLSATGTSSSGKQYDYTATSTWSSSNTAVASVANSTLAGLTSGLSPGSAKISAVTDAEVPLGIEACGDPPVCDDIAPMAGNATIPVPDATPLITGIDPSDWNSGATTPSVSITGQYFGTNPPTLGFSDGGISATLTSYNDSQIVANINVPSGTPNEDVSVTVTNNGYGGNAFNGTASGNSATSAAVYATVHLPFNAPEVTVIAWVNAQAPDLVNLPSGENATLESELNQSPSSCGLLVASWVAGFKVDITDAADAAYANAWLVAHSANPAPPSTITPSQQYSAGKYRVFNDFGKGSGSYQVGKTPDPCGTGLIPPGWTGGQASPYMGQSGISPSGETYQIAEGRIGTLGQLGSETINDGRTVPWIWSVIEFNAAGTPTYNIPNLFPGMFPTYSVYVNGSLVATYPQSSVAAFSANSATYQLTPPQIP